MTILKVIKAHVAQFQFPNSSTGSEEKETKQSYFLRIYTYVEPNNPRRVLVIGI